VGASGIPDAWPPQRSDLRRRVAPVFPLPKVYLYPRTLMPLHIFEPRYRQMVEDLLDRPGYVVMAAIQGGHEHEQPGDPPIYSVGGLGDIYQHHRLPDGRYLIKLAGLARVRLREIQSDRLYRMVEYEEIPEVPPSEAVAGELSPKLLEAIRQRCETPVDKLGELGPGQLADILLQTLDLPVDQMQAVYSEPTVAERARRALAEHAARS
jgi:Lon protease-like protein